MIYMTLNLGKARENRHRKSLNCSKILKSISIEDEMNAERSMEAYTLP